jgi:NAD(P)-dependent dehydrogenase (short-subunit alcohol dehydrogenase family)
MSTSGRVAGKVALVTGAASGIGRDTAIRLSAEGATVYAADVDEAGAAETAELGGGVSVSLDVASESSVSDCFRRLRETVDVLDILINNAGVVGRGSVEALEPQVWDATFGVNLRGTYLVSRAAWPLLRARGGAVLNTASVAGLLGIAGNAAYCVSKAGVVMLTKCMALDGAPLGIRVNCVCPGYTESAMSEQWLAAQPDPQLARAVEAARHPLGRMGRPRDIADAFVYLASDEAAWVTGAALVVDGGLTAGIWPP